MLIFDECISDQERLEASIQANECVSEFAYGNLISNKPNLTKNGALNCRLELGILDIIVDIGQAIVLSEITGAVGRWLHPSEYDYSKEILDKVTEIEANIEKLTKITQLVAYQDMMNKRRDLLDGLSAVTNSYFDEYCRKSMALPVGSSDEEYEKILVPLVEDWSTKICNGTNVYYVLETLMKRYLSVKMLDKYYPQIYDELGYYSYPWESKSYAFRQILREEDEYVILSNLIFTKAYFTIHKDEYHLKEIEKYCKIYQNFVESNPAQIHSYPICQIPGAELSFERTWTDYNWCGKLQDAKNGEWNLKKSNIKKNIYYNNHPENYLSIDEIKRIWTYYNGKAIYKLNCNVFNVLLDANLYDTNGSLISGFNCLDGSKWLIVQGEYSWEIKHWRKNKDKFLVKVFGLSSYPNTDPTNVVAEGCNFTSGIVPPQDYDPPMKCTNPGHATKTCGLYKVTKRGR